LHSQTRPSRHRVDSGKPSPSSSSRVSVTRFQATLTTPRPRVGWTGIADPPDRLPMAFAGDLRLPQPDRSDAFPRLGCRPRERDHGSLSATRHRSVAGPWKARGRRLAQLRAAIALALGFDTWRTLVHEHGLSEEQATSLAMWLTCDAK
jgi:hypothetical protein